MSYCPYCGSKVAGDADFCSCGYDLKTEEVAKAQAKIPTPDVKCAIHPARDSVGICASCGKAVCDLCRTVSGDKLYCSACVRGGVGKPRKETVSKFCKEYGCDLRVDESKKAQTPEAEWCVKGIDLNRMGKHKEALRCFDRSLEINPRHAAAWFFKGLALAGLGVKHQKVMDCFDKALEINPRWSEVWDIKGIVMGYMGKHKEELDCYNRALEINPNNFACLCNKGSILTEKGRYEEAIACYDRALETNPTRAEAWYKKGGTLLKIGKSQEALVCLKRFIEVASNNPEYSSEVKAAKEVINQSKKNTVVPPSEILTEGKDVNHWLKVLRSKKWEERFRALIALQYLDQDTEKIIPACIEALYDKEYLVSFPAAHVLCLHTLSGDIGIATLFNELNDESRDINERTEIIYVLQDTCHKDAIPALIKFLELNSTHLRVYAINHLSFFGPDAKDAIPYLKDALKDGDEEVRNAAAEALKEIEGNSQ